MSKAFKNLSDFSNYINKLEASYNPKLNLLLNICGEYLEQKSKDSIGNLQQGAGEFAAWKELADSTKTDKARKGYVYNADYNPLYRTGELQDSISHSVQGNSVSIGSNDDVMIYQELGTARIPPRSVLGMTMFKQRHVIEDAIGEFLFAWMTNAKQKKIKL